MELITFGFVETRTIFTMGAFSRRPVNGEIKVAWNDIGENSRYSCRCINEISWTIFLFSHSRRIPVEPDSLKRQKRKAFPIQVERVKNATCKVTKLIL